MKRYGYIWVTGVLFLGSLLGHWIMDWFTFVKDGPRHPRELAVGISAAHLAGRRAAPVAVCWLAAVEGGR